MTDFDWYKTVICDEPLEQGDFIEKCPIIIPPKNIENDKESIIRLNNVIIMSQSCDLKYDKIKIVLVCPYWPLIAFGERNSYFNRADGKESLRRGYHPRYHLLNKCTISGFESDYIVVDFSNVFGVHIDYLNEHILKREKRLRLLPPFREHFSQAFARFFMRVGLPSDIPEFK